MSVYGYLRVSTEEQVRHGVSLDAQEERIRQFCAFQGLVLTELISDRGVSAGKPLGKRPGGKMLLKKVKPGDQVISTKLDRMFRNTRDALETIDGWQEMKISVVFIDFGGSAVDSSSAAGRFLLTVLSAVAEMERNLARQRTAETTAFCKSHRRVYSRTPYGLKRDGKSKELLIDRTQMRVVNKIKDMRESGMSMNSIAGMLNDANIPTKTKKSWHHTTIGIILKNWETLYAPVVGQAFEEAGGEKE